jgi:hypothetical protein
VWFTEDAIAAWAAEPRTTRGGQPWYSPLAILTALTLRAVFRLAFRQTEGLIGSLISLLGLTLRVPDHTTFMWTAPHVNSQLKAAPALRSNGRTCGTAFGAAPGARTSVSWQDRITASEFRHLTDTALSARANVHLAHDCSPWHLMRQKMAAYAAAGSIWRGARREQQYRIYKWQYVHRYTEVTADIGKNRSALEKRSGQMRPYVRPVLWGLAPGHHGCALACQAPF